MPFLPCTAAARLDSVPLTGRDAAHPAICEIRLEARNAHPITELALIGHPGSKLCLTGRLREGRARRRSPDSPATHRRCPPARFCPPRERRNAGLAASPRAGHVSRKWRSSAARARFPRARPAIPACAVRRDWREARRGAALAVLGP